MIKNDDNLSELSELSSDIDDSFLELKNIRNYRLHENRPYVQTDATVLTLKERNKLSGDLESLDGSFISARDTYKKQNSYKDDYIKLVIGDEVNLQPIIFVYQKIVSQKDSIIRFMQRIVKSWQFNTFIMICIVVNTFLLALYNPVSDRYQLKDSLNDIQDISEQIFLSIFTVEAVLKLMALGVFYPPETAYFRSEWNWLDFILVIIGLAGLVNESNINLSPLRTFRLLRTFRGIKNLSKSLSLMTESLLKSGPQLFHVVSLLGIYFVVFGLVGVTLFKGNLTQFCLDSSEQLTELPFEITRADVMDATIYTDRLCSEFPENFGRSCPSGQICKRLPESYTQSSIVSFDTFFKSCLVVFQVMTLEGWSDIMYSLFDVTPSFYCLYFFLIILLGPFCFLNLFVIILAANYNEITTADTFKDIYEHSKVEAKKIFIEIANEGKALRERQQKRQLWSTVRKMKMRLMYSFEKGFDSISEKEYLEYKHEISPAEYEGWKREAVPAIEKKSRSHRLTLLKNTRLFKSVDNILANPSAEPSSASVFSSSTNARGGKEVQFNEVPPLLFHIQKSFSMHYPKEPVGLDGLKIRKNSEPIEVEDKSLNIDNEDAIEEQPVEQENEDPTESKDQSSGVYSAAQGSPVANEPAENSKPIIQEAQAVLLRAQSSLSHIKIDVSEEVKSALQTLKTFLNDAAEPTEDKNELGKVGNIVINNSSSQRKPQNIQSRVNANHDVARGLLTDKISVKISYRIVNNLCFQRTIIVLIAINVLCLSFIKFDMNQTLRLVITELNFGLTIVFTVELLLKIYAFGATLFFKDALNFMDFCIIFPTMIGLLITRNTSSSKNAALTAISSLRVFRLFQLMKLPQVQPHTKSLQKLIQTLGLTLKHVCPFFFLLIFFILLFTILGLHLFGGELIQNFGEELNYSSLDFNSTNNFQNEVFYDIVECILVDEKFVHCPIRSNFDNFLWSFVTTFQILSLENWNAVFEETLNAKGQPDVFSYIYFFSLVSFGVFLVLQLFLAVVIDSFNSSHSDRRLLLKQAWLREYHKNKATVIETNEEEEKLEKLAVKLAGQKADGKSSFSPESHVAFKSTSLLLFSPRNRFRLMCAKFINNKYVEYFIIFCIFVSCVMLAFDENTNRIVYFVNIILVVVFNLEAGLKIISFGLVLREGSYLRDPWNIVDFVIAVVMSGSYLVSNDDSAQFTAVKLLRSFRVLRPLRVVRRFESLRIIVRTLFQAVFPCFWIGLLCILVYWIGGMISIGMFGGKMRSCMTNFTNDEYMRRTIADCESLTEGCPRNGVLCMESEINYCENFENMDTFLVPFDNETITQYCFNYDSENFNFGCDVVCPAQDWLNTNLYSTSGLYFSNHRNGVSVNFETIPEAMRTLFEVSMIEGWPTVMHLTTDIVGVGREPRRNAAPINSLFWIIFLFVTKLLLLQLLIAVIIETFLLTNDKETGSAFMSPTQSRWVEARQQATLSKPQKNASIKSMVFYKLITHKHFDNFISFVIMLNTILLIFVNDKEQLWYQVFDLSFAIIYIGEAIVKIRGIGCYGYFSDARNIFDFVVVMSVTLEFVLNSTKDFIFSGGTSVVGETILNNIEVLRALRVLKLMYKIEGVADILNTLTIAIPSIFNMSLVLFLALFMFTVLGVDLFSDIYPDDRFNFFLIDEYVNFSTFFRSLNTLGRMATGESWNGIMHELSLSSPNAYWFCILYTLVFQFLLLNLFVAVVLSSFILSFDKLKHDRKVAKNIKQFSHAWTKCSRLWGRRMRRKLRQDAGLQRDVSFMFDDRLSIQSLHMYKQGCFSFMKQRQILRKERVVSKMVKKIKDDDYLPFTEFTNILRQIPPPLGIKGLGIENDLTEAQTMKLVAKVKIPVTKTGLINYQQTLFALVDHALGSDLIPTEVQQLLDYRLPEKVVHKTRTTAKETASHSIQELYAVSRLQLVMRNYMIVRKIKKLRQEGYTEDQISSMVSEAKDKATAAKVFTNLLRPV